MSAIAVGDIITAYHKGYHKVIRLYQENGYPLVEYKMVLNSKGTKAGAGTTRHCHVNFCDVVTKDRIHKEFLEDRARLNEKVRLLSNILKENGEQR